MVLKESEPAPTRLVELITPQPEGESRCYIQPKPHLKQGEGQKKDPDLGSGSTRGGSNQICQQKDNHQSLASFTDTSENTEGAKNTAEETAATTVTAEIVVAERTKRPSQLVDPEATRTWVT